MANLLSKVSEDGEMNLVRIASLKFKFTRCVHTKPVFFFKNPEFANYSRGVDIELLRNIHAITAVFVTPPREGRGGGELARRRRREPHEWKARWRRGVMWKVSSLSHVAC